LMNLENHALAVWSLSAQAPSVRPTLILVDQALFS